MNDHHPEIRIDPDPVTIIATCVSAVAAVLQLVQVGIEFRKMRNPPSPTSGTVFFPQIETTSRDLLDKLLQIQRVIDNGSADPDAEFYDAKFRIGTSLKLTPSQMQRLSMLLPFVHSGNLANTINALITSDPALAANLGDAIDKRIPGTQDRVNHAIVDGHNRDLLLEAKSTLQAIIEEMERRDRPGN